MRALISELGRDPLPGGLVPALSRHVAEIAEQESVRVTLTAPMELPALTPDREAHLFSISREALANAVKHSGSPTAYVRIMALSGHVVVEIGDDGRGFDPDGKHPGHFGLRSMHSRAAEIGGQLSITSAPGQGTVVRAEAPAGDG